MMYSTIRSYTKLYGNTQYDRVMDKVRYNYLNLKQKEANTVCEGYIYRLRTSCHSFMMITTIVFLYILSYGDELLVCMFLFYMQIATTGDFLKSLSPKNGLLRGILYYSHNIYPANKCYTDLKETQSNNQILLDVFNFFFMKEWNKYDYVEKETDTFYVGQKKCKTSQMDKADAGDLILIVIVDFELVLYVMNQIGEKWFHMGLFASSYFPISRLDFGRLILLYHSLKEYKVQAFPKDYS
ncbi:hypothetical protein K501DRAFT_278405 [Backusella circina FSU 941]|nr:hypothetical protein K501DRAFT_278405 [Backusella circina FSU 941]